MYKKRMTDIQRKVVLAFAENDMKMTLTAKAVPCHLSTLANYMQVIKGKYGLDPKCFYDLCELVKIAREDA